MTSIVYKWAVLPVDLYIHACPCVHNVFRVQCTVHCTFTVLSTVTNKRSSWGVGVLYQVHVAFLSWKTSRCYTSKIHFYAFWNGGWHTFQNSIESRQTSRRDVNAPSYCHSRRSPSPIPSVIIAVSAEKNGQTTATGARLHFDCFVRQYMTRSERRRRTRGGNAGCNPPSCPVCHKILPSVVRTTSSSE